MRIEYADIEYLEVIRIRVFQFRKLIMIIRPMPAIGKAPLGAAIYVVSFNVRIESMYAHNASSHSNNYK